MIINQFPMEKVNGIFTAVALYIGHRLLFTVNHSGSVQSGILHTSSSSMLVTWPRHFTCLIQCVTFEKYDCFTLSFHVLFKMSDHIHKIALELKGQVERIALWDAALLIFGSLYCVFIMQKYAALNTAGVMQTGLIWLCRVFRTPACWHFAVVNNIWGFQL